MLWVAPFDLKIPDTAQTRCQISVDNCCQWPFLADFLLRPLLYFYPDSRDIILLVGSSNIWCVFELEISSSPVILVQWLHWLHLSWAASVSSQFVQRNQATCKLITDAWQPYFSPIISQANFLPRTHTYIINVSLCTYLSQYFSWTPFNQAQQLRQAVTKTDFYPGELAEVCWGEEGRRRRNLHACCGSTPHSHVSLRKDWGSPQCCVWRLLSRIPSKPDSRLQVCPKQNMAFVDSA